MSKRTHIKRFNEMKIEPQNEALGVMSFRIKRGISDLLHSFGLSNDKDYHEMHDQLEKEVIEMLKKHGVTVI